MISEEKARHIVHLIIEGIEKAGYASFPDRDSAMKEAKSIAFKYVSQVNSVAELARNRILSQKNPPPEYSPQWDTLYRKYFEEEMAKKGG